MKKVILLASVFLLLAGSGWAQEITIHTPIHGSDYARDKPLQTWRCAETQLGLANQLEFDDTDGTVNGYVDCHGAIHGAAPPPPTTGGTCSGIVQAGVVCAGPAVADGTRSLNAVQANSASVLRIPPAAAIPAGTLLTTALLQPVTVGDQLAVFVLNGYGITSADTFTVTDSLGNVFAQVAAFTGTGYSGAAAFVAPVTVAGVDSVTVTNSTAQDLWISAYAAEYQNLGAYEGGTINAGQPSTGPGYLVSSVTTTHADDTVIGLLGAESVDSGLALQLVSASWNVLPVTQAVGSGPVGFYNGQLINAFASVAGVYSTNVFSNHLTGLNAQQSAALFVFQPLTTNLASGAMIPRFPSPSGLLPVVTFDSLGIPADGMVVYCPDCDAPASPGAVCTSAGAKVGAEAHRINNEWQCVDGPGAGGINPLTAMGQVFGGGTAGAPVAIGAGKTFQTLTSAGGLGPAAFQSPLLPVGNGGLPVATSPYLVQCDTSSAVVDGGSQILLTAGASVVTVPDIADSGCGPGFVFQLVNISGAAVTVNSESGGAFAIITGIGFVSGTSFSLPFGQSATLSALGGMGYLVNMVGGSLSGVMTASGGTASVSLASSFFSAAPTCVVQDDTLISNLLTKTVTTSALTVTTTGDTDLVSYICH
jgi:hypothetical protein